MKTRTVTSRAKWLLLLWAVLAAALLAGCSSQPSPTQRQIVYGTPFQPNSLNPISSPDIVSRSAIEMIFDGLVAADENSRLNPELATSWDVSPDGKEWMFHLRQGVHWHDGRDFTADDVKFTYDTVLDPNSKPTVPKADYAAIERVEVVDAHTVRFRLSHPYAPFLSRLVLGIAPKHLLAGQDLATTPFNRLPTGTGPFSLERWDDAQSLVFKRNPEYFGTKPAIDRLVWKIVPDSSVLALQALNGEVDGAPVFNPKDASTLLSSGKMALRETLEGNTQISLQLKNPILQDQRVRQALAYAIDGQALIDKIMDGAAAAATSDILPNSWAYNPDVRRYPYEPATARRLLSEAGWRAGPDGTQTKDGKRLSISLMTDAGNKTREQTMAAVRQYWSDVGVEVNTSTQERNSFIFQKVLKGDFDAVLLQSSVQIDPDLSRRFHTDSIKNGQNFVNYSDPAVDRLLEQGLASLDQEQRKRAYFELQRIMADGLPQISLFYTKTQFAFKPNLTGVKPSPTNLFWNAEEWAWH